MSTTAHHTPHERHQRGTTGNNNAHTAAIPFRTFTMLRSKKEGRRVAWAVSLMSARKSTRHVWKPLKGVAETELLPV